jgi:class 3 adenylate cyclase
VPAPTSLLPHRLLNLLSRSVRTRLLQGWAAMLLSLGLVAVLPGAEHACYDNVILFYRLLPVQFDWTGGYSGLHRSITVIGDDGLDPRLDEQAFYRKVISRLRFAEASATCWITDDAPKAAPELTNGVLETSPVYTVPTTTQLQAPKTHQPPFVLKKDDHDGAVRDFYLALKLNGELVPCLPLVLYARFLDHGECPPTVQGATLLLGDQRIPVAEDETGYSLPLLPHLSQLRAQVRLGDHSEASFSHVADTLEPLRLSSLEPANSFIYSRAHRRFFFLGDWQMTAVGVRATSLAAFRDFQVAALTLDTLIQGPHVRRVEGWAFVVYCLVISSYLALLLLSPTSLAGRIWRLGLVFAAIYFFSLAALALGYYFPLAWLYIYSLLLTAWVFGRVWLTTLNYLRRYGGRSAARMLLQGGRDLDHREAEERVATIVFVGLPDHLRALETVEDPRMLDHRQIFSSHVATLTAQFDGLVHDFQADYLMLGFGTQPGHPDIDHARKGFEVAQRLVALRPELQKAWNSDDPQGARVQVSINSGLVAVGWVGTRMHKRASAAIGDTTNVAARLLGTAKKLDLDLVVAASSYHLLEGAAQFVPLPPVHLKGKTEAVAIYKLAAEGPTP